MNDPYIALRGFYNTRSTLTGIPAYVGFLPEAVNAALVAATAAGTDMVAIVIQPNGGSAQGYASRLNQPRVDVHTHASRGILGRQTQEIIKNETSQLAYYKDGAGNVVSKATLTVNTNGGQQADQTFDYWTTYVLSATLK